MSLVCVYAMSMEDCRLVYLVVGDIACAAGEVDGHVWQLLRDTIHDTRKCLINVIEAERQNDEVLEGGANLRRPAESPAAGAEGRH
jgi:hypothetical protein